MELIFTNNSRFKKIDDSLEEITKFLESINIPNSKYCPLCGKEVGEENPTQTIDFEGLPIKVDRDCIDVIYKKKKKIEKNLIPHQIIMEKVS